MVVPYGTVRNGWRGVRRVRLPDTAHTAQPWRVHEVTRDFRVEDVWALPTPGGPGDFPRLVQMIASGDGSQGTSCAARALWTIRRKIGQLLGWDDPDAGAGFRVPALRGRLPAGLRDAPSGPDFDSLPFTPLYLLGNEFAAEIANRTMHGVLHLGWLPDGPGRYRGQMAVLVKPDGLFGTAYMAVIRPLRRLIVYPAMIRHIERAWRAPLLTAPRQPGSGTRLSVSGTGWRHRHCPTPAAGTSRRALVSPTPRRPARRRPPAGLSAAL
jgi:hypothetical protein